MLFQWFTYEMANSKSQSENVHPSETIFSQKSPQIGLPHYLYSSLMPISQEPT